MNAQKIHSTELSVKHPFTTTKLTLKYLGVWGKKDYMALNKSCHNFKIPAVAFLLYSYYSRTFPHPLKYSKECHSPIDCIYFLLVHIMGIY